MKYHAAAILFAATMLTAPIMAERKAISTTDAPAAIGPYVQGVATGNTLYVSGQIALDPRSGTLVTGDIKAQTQQVFRNLAAVLAANGMTLDDVVQTQVYMTNLDEFAAMNEVYAQFFKTPPARATVGVAALPRKASVEIALIAVRDRPKGK
jgi:2-iminobutanoate/2-iminopropanoate deaminase